LFWSYHDDNYLYMLLEYVPGGELFSYLRNAHKFENDKALFYATEITSALASMHEKDIIYRDMKPENVLIDQGGHVKLTDFGFAKKVKDRTWTLCGTPEYLAPEIIQSKGHGKAVDWWSLGILIYEMLAGFPPFFDENPFDIYRKILEGRLEFPRHFEAHARDLIKKLLIADRTKRLGCLRRGTKDVMEHKWFSSRGFTWEDVYKKKLVPPFVPIVSHAGDHQNFEDFDEDEEFSTECASADERMLFENF
jgi:protein kinase X